MSDFEALLADYLSSLKNYTTESSIAQRFLGFLREAFREVVSGVAGELYPELEQYVSDSAIALRGRMDAILGNLIIEFKTDLDRFGPDAEVQLKKYTAALWNNRKKRNRFVLMASDGIRLSVYLPRTPKPLGEPVSPEDVHLDLLDSIRIDKTEPREAWMWLDRYVLTLPEKAKPLLPNDFVRDFGLGSPVQRSASNRLAEALEMTPSVAVLYDEWDRYLSYVYGVSVGSKDLFVRHTYMAFLTKLMLFSWYSGGALPSREQLGGILAGSAFAAWGMKNLMEEDFFTWPTRAPQDLVAEAAYTLLERLKTYDLSEVRQDVLKGIYQNLVDPSERHDLGEYYTPDWLAEMIVGDTLKDPSARVLDPACGSGTFLMAAIAKLREINKLPEPAYAVKIRGSLVNIKSLNDQPLARETTADERIWLS